MEVISRNSALICGIVGLTFVGLCFYFKRKRKMFVCPKKKLNTKRSETKLPDENDIEAVHSFAFEHFVLGKQLMLDGKLNEGIEAFATAVAAYGEKQEIILKSMANSFPPHVYKLLEKKIPDVRAKLARYDARKSDMWSLGVVAYVMLNKRLPFNGAGTQEAMVQRQLERKVSFENKDTSPQYRVAVMALLEPDVIKRFGATAFLNTGWVRMDERLTVRSKHEKEALTRAMAHREKILGTVIPHPTSASSISASAQAKRESAGKEPGGSDPLVLRQEQPSSYSSVLRENAQVQEQDNHSLRHGMSKKKEAAVTSKSSTRHAK